MPRVIILPYSWKYRQSKYLVVWLPKQYVVIFVKFNYQLAQLSFIVVVFEP